MRKTANRHTKSILYSKDGLKRKKTLRIANNTALKDAVFIWCTQIKSLSNLFSFTDFPQTLKFNDKLDGPSNFKASSRWLMTGGLGDRHRHKGVRNSRRDLI